MFKFMFAIILLLLGLVGAVIMAPYLFIKEVIKALTE